MLFNTLAFLHLPIHSFPGALTHSNHTSHSSPPSWQKQRLHYSTLHSFHNTAISTVRASATDSVHLKPNSFSSSASNKTPIPPWLLHAADTPQQTDNHNHMDINIHHKILNEETHLASDSAIPSILAAFYQSCCHLLKSPSSHDIYILTVTADTDTLSGKSESSLSSESMSISSRILIQIRDIVELSSSSAAGLVVQSDPVDRLHRNDIQFQALQEELAQLQARMVNDPDDMDAQTAMFQKAMELEELEAQYEELQAIIEQRNQTTQESGPGMHQGEEEAVLDLAFKYQTQVPGAPSDMLILRKSSYERNHPAVTPSSLLLEEFKSEQETAAEIQKMRHWVEQVIIKYGLCPFTATADLAGISLSKAGIQPGPVAYPVTSAVRPEPLLRDAWATIARLLACPEQDLSTILLCAPWYAPHHLRRFNAASIHLIDALRITGVSRLVGTVFFHPHYDRRNAAANTAGLPASGPVAGHLPPEQFYRQYLKKRYPLMRHDAEKGRPEDWLEETQQAAVQNKEALVDRQMEAANYARRSPFPMINFLRMTQVHAAKEGTVNSEAIYARNAKRLEMVGLQQLDQILNDV